MTDGETVRTRVAQSMTCMSTGHRSTWPRNSSPSLLHQLAPRDESGNVSNGVPLLTGLHHAGGWALTW
jgi:hypothetical protein